MKKPFAAQVLPAATFACGLMASSSSTRFVARDVLVRVVSTNAMAVQLQTTKLDLSSPEKSVRSFVAALNASRFEEAALCVDGAAAHTDYKPLRQMWSEEKPTILLSALSVSAKGDKAIARVKVAVKSRSDKQSRTENVSLVRRGARWLLVPLNPNIPLTGESLLSSLATLIHSPKTLLATRDIARRTTCSSNLKQIALAASVLNQDDKKLTITPQDFKARLFPILKTMQLFHCPSVHSGESYSFNGNLANLNPDKVSKTTVHRLVMFYEGKNGKLVFRHLGTSNVAFADGHVKAISRSEAKTLRWKP